MDEIIGLLGWGEYLTIVCGIAALVAAVAPPATEASPAWWRQARRVLDILAANVRHARNRMP